VSRVSPYSSPIGGGTTVTITGTDRFTSFPPPGYWLATAGGAVFAAGQAPGLGRTQVASSDPVVGIASTADGRGYWLVTADGDDRSRFLTRPRLATNSVLCENGCLPYRVRQFRLGGCPDRRLTIGNHHGFARRDLPCRRFQVIRSPRGGTPDRAGADRRGLGAGSAAGSTAVGNSGSSAYDWPEFHQGPLDQGYASNSTITTADAASLGISWATNMYAPALDSPVVAYDATLDETLAYIGTESGDLEAVNTANGQIVWGTWLGSPIRTTPVVSNGEVYVGTFDSPRIYNVNATTGAIECYAASPQPIEGTPTIDTPPGGVPTLYVGTNDSQVASGPILAINASTCAVEWSFSGYLQTAGAWDAMAYALDAGGVPLILFGTADPDSTVYAVNALTGVEVWHYSVDNPPPGAYDVGAGVTVSPPGDNGFSDGVAYVPSKYGIMYALDLTTGALIWQFNFNKAAGVKEGGRSTAALDGKNLVFGYNGGLFDLNAATGAVIWQYKDPTDTEALSSPAIAGAASSEVVTVGEIGGGVDVVSLATGAQLYRYQTGGYISASPAVSGGDIIIASSDGFLYSFAVGGRSETTLPTTAITSPADSSALPNPSGSLTVTGTATDGTALAGVEVAVQEGGVDGQWWDAATSSWTSGPMDNAATLASPGTTASTWSLAYPVAQAGGTYQVTAYAVSTTGQSDTKGAHTGFSVAFSTKGAHIMATPTFIAPGSSVTLTGSGYTKGETVTVSLLGTALATETVNTKGNLAAKRIKIPTNTAFGQTSLVASGATSGRSATAAITVANSWDQRGYSPSHVDFEPNDPSLYNLVHPGNNIFLDPAWQYQAGSAVDTSPAVVDDVAYIGDAAGQLTAIDVHNGAPLWSWTMPGTAVAIDGSPAVDAAKNLVFVGADNGTLYAISTTTGTLVWSAALGGDVSSPVVVGGEVYITTTTTIGSTKTGVVGAYAEAGGAKTWTVTLASTTTSPPAVDSAAGVVVVGESNGQVVTLSTLNGGTKWTFATAGAVTAAATIYAGTVYVGSWDGNVYAISESTGTKIWSYQTKGPVADTGAVTSQLTPKGTLELLIGSGDGYMYELDAATGNLEYKVNFDSAITGVAAVRGVALVETASGVIGSARTYTDLDVWQYQTAAPLVTSPVIVDGAIYVGAADGHLYAFTTYGQPPQ
jgi:outer membrane protein assembly factor BamB